MANITRYTPFENPFDDIAMEFFLELTLPKKAGGGKRITIQ